MQNIKFEILNSEIVEINERNFIEIAKKKAISSDIEREFFSISRGYLNQKGERKFKNSVSIPPEAIEKVLLALDRIKS
ncbi:MAG: hypothetical protein QXF15_00665 [Candidatus Aenigmatarchaeota archaeon]|nr:hypothetical protein [Candidatus Aenigmarchaeota archaeon]